MNTDELLIPGKLGSKEAELRASFLAHVDVIPGGEKIKKCIQCGTCTGSCPLSYAMDIMPRKLVALFRAGDMETIFRSKTIWICASCYSCQTRCPSGIKVTDIVYALKRTAMEKQIYTKGFLVHSLSNSFIHVLKNLGRLNEPRLMARFYMKSNIWKSVTALPLALKIARKGRLDYKSAKIKDLAGLRKIIQKAELMDLPKEVYRREYVKGAVGYKAVS